LVFVGCAPQHFETPVSTPVGSPFVIIADFDSGDRPNNIGGDFGSWDKDPEDATQSCRAGFDAENADGLNVDGFSLRLIYDVNSPNEAYNGFWMKLEGVDLSEYNTLNLDIRGDAEKGFTDRLKIELKSFEQKDFFYVGNVGSEWKRVKIPLKEFRKIKNFSAMNEFVIVFEDSMSVPKSGAILIDNISFSRENI